MDGNPSTDMSGIIGHNRCSNLSRLRSDEDIGIESGGACRWQTVPPCIRPKIGGTAPHGCGHGQVGEEVGKLIEATQPRRRKLPCSNHQREFATNLIVGDVRDIHRGTGRHFLNEPRLNRDAADGPIMRE